MHEGIHHMMCCGQQQSQNARQHWEAALAAKAASMQQLEEALAAKDRVIEQLRANQHAAFAEPSQPDESAQLRDQVH